MSDAAPPEPQQPRRLRKSDLPRDELGRAALDGEAGQDLAVVDVATLRRDVDALLAAVENGESFDFPRVPRRARPGRAS